MGLRGGAGAVGGWWPVPTLRWPRDVSRGPAGLGCLRVPQGQAWRSPGRALVACGHAAISIRASVRGCSSWNPIKSVFIVPRDPLRSAGTRAR